MNLSLLRIVHTFSSRCARAEKRRGSRRVVGHEGERRREGCTVAIARFIAASRTRAVNINPYLPVCRQILVAVPAAVVCCPFFVFFLFVPRHQSIAARTGCRRSPSADILPQTPSFEKPGSVNSNGSSLTPTSTVLRYPPPPTSWVLFSRIF